MDWFMHGLSSSTLGTPATTCQPSSGHPPRPVCPPQLQGDPTFLYGGYGYRPPTFGYAWLNGASQPTSYGQLHGAAAPAATGNTNKGLAMSKSVSAPDLQNTAALQEHQDKVHQLPSQQQLQQQRPSKMQGTTPVARQHRKHLSTTSVPPGTPGEQSAANTPSSSRASTPPRRGSCMSDTFYIGMGAV